MITLWIDLTQSNSEITGFLYAPPPENLLSVEKGIHSTDVIAALVKLGKAWLKGTGQKGEIRLRKDLAKRA